MNVTTLGECQFPSPVPWSVSDSARVPAHIERDPAHPPAEEVLFELAGPRPRLFFNPSKTRAGIVTCGGLCPGLNNVIRSLFMQLHYGYGVAEIWGFRYGYRGLDPDRGEEPIRLTPTFVENIHQQGGTVLGSSRGPVDKEVALKNLMRRKINLLFCVGGDGTQRGAHELFETARKHDYPLAVIGIPKTIDNDVRYVSRTFGYLTALDAAREVIACAHTEARSENNGVGLVKLMGRHAGFIAAGATIASQDVNFTLIPEVPFKLDGKRGFLPVLKDRLLARKHAVVVVAEGAGQELISDEPVGYDASGNIKLRDIGRWLRERIEEYFAQEKVPMRVRYFDPSYIIRSRPANCEDAILCDRFARHAVHAAMTGKTGVVIGYMHDTFIHVPMSMVAGAQKFVNPNGELWHAVLSATGQPARFE